MSEGKRKIMIPKKLLRKFPLRRQVVADALEIYIEWYWKQYQKHLFSDVGRFERRDFYEADIPDSSLVLVGSQPTPYY